MPDQTTPAAEWWADPDVISWDWKEQPDLDRLAALLAHHGVTLTEVDTGSDQYAIRITGPELEQTKLGIEAQRLRAEIAERERNQARERLAEAEEAIELYDRDRRREWAAALRYGRNDVAQAGWPNAANLLDDLAAAVESGDLTPWADQPEPATAAARCDVDVPDQGGLGGWDVCGRGRPCPVHDQPPAPPAQPSAAAPAAAGPHPDTPDRARDALEAMGREVDAAWRTLAAAFTAASGHIAAAVDALDGDQPAEPARKRHDARLVADPIHTCVTPRGRREECAGCAAEAAELAIQAAPGRCTALTRHTDINGDDMVPCDNPLPCPWHLAEMPEPDPAQEAEMDAGIAEFAALPDCTHCEGTGKQVPDGWYERRRDAERRAAELIQPAVDALTPDQFDALVAGSRSEPAPEPDSGPGPNPGSPLVGAVAMADAVAAKLGTEDAEVVRRVIRHARALARRCAIRFEETQAARAELAEVTADRNRYRDDARSEVHQLRAELAGARRDAAADALEDGAGRVRRVFTETTGPRVAQYLDAVARRYRTAVRPVPGSPQPTGEVHVHTAEEWGEPDDPRERTSAGSPQPAEGGGDDGAS